MIKELEKRPEEFVAAVRDTAVKYSIKELSEKARAEKDPVIAFAAVYNAVIEGLGLTPFDEQILAGGYLDDEAIVELPTGEGKTIAAVFAAPALSAGSKKPPCRILPLSSQIPA